MAKRKLAVLGGGMGSLSAVFWLTRDPTWQDQFEITVYQLGWRLGGKAASGREPDTFDRSLEHGFHVLLGFYDNVFLAMMECYRELGRDPGAPLAEFAALTPDDEEFDPRRYAVMRHHNLQIAQPFQGQTHFIPFNLPANGLIPGDGTYVDVWSVFDLAFDTLLKFIEGTLFEIGTEPETKKVHRSLLKRLEDGVEHLVSFVETEFDRLLSLPPSLEILRALWNFVKAQRALGKVIRKVELLVVELVKAHVRHHWEKRGRSIQDDWAAYRDWILLDMTSANLCGILTDELITRGFDVVNHLNYVDWWMSHAAVREGSLVTVNSSLGQFPYDLVFGYRQGDTQSPPAPGKPYRGSPDVEAGTMLRGLFHFLVAYKGAPEWLPQAGCGEVLVAPMYQLLKRRGVRFEFFSNVKGLHLDAERRNIAGITVERQATLKNGEYQPLFDVDGLACWPQKPFFEQLVEGEQLEREGINLESWWTPWKGRTETLTRGADFDEVLLGIPVGALPYICGELKEASTAWRNMLDHLQTNRPTVLQAWFEKTLEQMGWPYGIVNGDIGTEPFNLETSMNQLLGRERWPEQDAPRSLIYYSGIFPDDPNQPAPPDPQYPRQQHAALREVAIEFLGRYAGVYCPQASPDGAFLWRTLSSVKDPGLEGPHRIDAQYWRVNIDPSERYVLSVTGSSQYRLTAGGSGFENLYLAGDWIQNGINAGCMEATFTSGLDASRAISGGPGRMRGERDWKMPSAPIAAGAKT